MLSSNTDDGTALVGGLLATRGTHPLADASVLHAEVLGEVGREASCSADSSSLRSGGRVFGGALVGLGALQRDVLDRLGLVEGPVGAHGDAGHAGSQGERELAIGLALGLGLEAALL
jgi:hypothetical protein